MTPEEQMRQFLSPEIQEVEPAYEEDTTDAPSKLITLSQKNNLVEDFADVIDDVKNQITTQFDSDEAEMDDWLTDYSDAIELAKMDPETEQKDFPFEGASRVMAPFVMEAAIEFNSRYTIEILSSKTPAYFEVAGFEKKPIPKAVVPYGEQAPPEPEVEADPKEERAERCSKYFNVKLKKGNWSSESDMESMALPIVGTAYKKIYWDHRVKRIVSKFVSADQIIFSQQQSFEDAPQHAQKTSFSRNELIGNLHAGVFDFDPDDLKDNQVDWEGLEIHFYWDFDGDGFEEPYIATWVDGLDQIVRIRAGYIAEGIHSHEGNVTAIDRKEYFAQKKLLSDPSGGPMGMGFGILLKDTYQTINTNLRQLVDSGTLYNTASNSGLIANTTSPKMGADSRMEQGPLELSLGKLLRVNVSSGSTLAQNVVQLPFKGPSAVLFQLLQYLDETSRRMTTVSYNVESNAGEASSLYLARLREGYKVYNAMMYRVYRGLTKEFEIMARCMFEYAEELQADYVNVLDEEASMSDDFNPKDCDIFPTANPAHGSAVERMAKAQVEIDAAQAAPNLVNQREAYKDYFEAVGIEDIDALMPEQTGPTPLEQQQAAYMAMEAEFRKEELNLKKEKLAQDDMKMQLDALAAAAKFEQEMMETQSKIDVNIAKSLETMNKVAIEKIGIYQTLLDRGEQNLKQDVGQTNDRPRGSQNMARSPGNAKIPGVS